MKRQHHSCPICHMTGKVIDKLTQQPRPCTICRGTGYVKNDQYNDVQKPKRRPGRLQQEIIRTVYQWQKKYFKTRNPLDLRPMSMIDIAKAMDVHLTSVSLRINEIMVMDIPAKKLFGWRFGDHHALKVQEMIRLMILHEHEPLSDPQIRQKLLDQQVPISLRSVCKIRMTLGLPGANQRRILKFINSEKYVSNLTNDLHQHHTGR